MAPRAVVRLQQGALRVVELLEEAVVPEAEAVLEEAPVVVGAVALGAGALAVGEMKSPYVAAAP
ncbi:MAG: hypothetical protein J0L73_28195 [Verrucomicrobia bacterium]|nr:hypothetical protein [Verrucomicrobiota bacterium]